MDRQVLYAKGHCCVAGVARDGKGYDLALDSSAVVTATGAAVRHDSTSDPARDWLERRLLEDARARGARLKKIPARARH